MCLSPPSSGFLAYRQIQNYLGLHWLTRPHEKVLTFSTYKWERLLVFENEHMSMWQSLPFFKKKSQGNIVLRCVQTERKANFHLVLLCKSYTHLSDFCFTLNCTNLMLKGIPFWFEKQCNLCSAQPQNSPGSPVLSVVSFQSLSLFLSSLYVGPSKENFRLIV